MGLVADPEERYDLAGALPDVVHELTAELKALRAGAPWSPTYPPDADPCALLSKTGGYFAPLDWAPPAL